MRVAAVGNVELQVPPSFELQAVSADGLADEALEFDVVVVEARARLVEQAVVAARRRHVPLLVASADRGLRAIRWICSGASGLIGGALDGSDSPPADAPLGERVVHFAQKSALTLRFAVLRGTPLEGDAEFEQGRFVGAQFCGLNGLPALTEMLQLDESPVEVKGVGPRRKTHVLLVDDDPVILAMLKRRFELAGLRVSTASHGLEALALLPALRVDIVVSDLDMPQLDGWGLLSAVRADVELCELPVVLLSAYDDQLGALKAARCGARAYISKLAPHQELVATVELLTEPRRKVVQALEAKQSCPVNLVALGAQWLLELIEELEVSATLQLEDELGRYELEVAGGSFRSAVAQRGSLRVVGDVAVEALTTSRGVGQLRIERRETEVPEGSVTELVKVLKRVRLSQQSESRFESDERLAVTVSPELAELWARSGSPHELRVLEALEEISSRGALCEVGALAAQTSVELPRLQRTLRELQRRGVITTSR